MRDGDASEPAARHPAQVPGKAHQALGSRKDLLAQRGEALNAIGRWLVASLFPVGHCRQLCPFQWP